MSPTLTLTPSISAAVTAYRAARALREEAGRAVRPIIHADAAAFDGSNAYVMACQAEDGYAQQLADLVADAAQGSISLTVRASIKPEDVEAWRANRTGEGVALSDALADVGRKAAP